MEFKDEARDSGAVRKTGHLGEPPVLLFTKDPQIEIPTRTTRPALMPRITGSRRPFDYADSSPHSTDTIYKLFLEERLGLV